MILSACALMYPYQHAWRGKVRDLPWRPVPPAQPAGAGLLGDLPRPAAFGASGSHEGEDVPRHPPRELLDEPEPGGTIRARG